MHGPIAMTSHRETHCRVCFYLAFSSYEQIPTVAIQSHNKYQGLLQLILLTQFLSSIYKKKKNQCQYVAREISQSCKLNPKMGSSLQSVFPNPASCISPCTVSSLTHPGTHQTRPVYLSLDHTSMPRTLCPHTEPLVPEPGQPLSGLPITARPCSLSVVMPKPRTGRGQLFAKDVKAQISRLP